MTATRDDLIIEAAASTFWARRTGNRPEAWRMLSAATRRVWVADTKAALAAADAVAWLTPSDVPDWARGRPAWVWQPEDATRVRMCVIPRDDDFPHDEDAALYRPIRIPELPR